jgi:3-hydroxyisobutyrate dehydrogenase-like beta-hydroxyacid dehydrogenase
VGHESPATLGVIGLGRMGLPVAERLQTIGHRVVGFRRVWPDNDGRFGKASSPRDLLEQTQIIFTCLPDDAALLEVIGGDNGLVAGNCRGGIVIDLSMTSLQSKHDARELLWAAGAEMLDAPISGSPKVVAEGKASLFVSGPEDVYRQVRPFLDFAASARLVGPFGTGSKLKFIANLLIGIHIAAAAEAIALAEHAGLDADLVIDTISNSVAASEMFRQRAQRMARRDFDAPMNDINSFLKDVELIQDFVGQSAATSALFDLSGGLYTRAAEFGLGEKEVAAIVTLLT